MVRQASIGAAQLRQTTTTNQDANAALTIPQNPNAVPVAQPTAVPVPAGQPAATTTSSSSSDALIIAAISIGSIALVSSCCVLAVLLASRRKDKKRQEEDAFIRQRLVDGMADAKPPVWGTSAV